MKPKHQYEPQDLVTHRDIMLLIDEVIDFGKDWIDCRVRHKRGCSFSNEQGQTPTWVGLEYMCQAIAALAGTQRLAAGRAITTGFVIGSRNYSTCVSHFEQNQHVLVCIKEEMKNESSLGVYACKIKTANHQLLAEARIKAVMPENPNIIINFRR